jgi:hypothetical protein
VVRARIKTKTWLWHKYKFLNELKCFGASPNWRCTSQKINSMTLLFSQDSWIKVSVIKKLELCEQEVKEYVSLKSLVLQRTVSGIACRMCWWESNR